MTKDILLDSSGDIAFINGDIAFTNEEQSLLQRIKIHFLTIKGEWFLGQTIGIPYYEEIFKKDFDLSRIESTFIKEMKGIDGVTAIKSIDMDIDKATRKLTVTMVIIDNLNQELEIII